VYGNAGAGRRYAKADLMSIQDAQNDVLVKLADVNLTVSDPNQDIRNRKVIDLQV